MRTLRDWIRAIRHDFSAFYPFADWMEEQGLELKGLREFLSHAQLATKIWRNRKGSLHNYIGIMTSNGVGFLYLNDLEFEMREGNERDDESFIDLLNEYGQIRIIK